MTQWLYTIAGKVEADTEAQAVIEAWDDIENNPAVVVEVEELGREREE